MTHWLLPTLGFTAATALWLALFPLVFRPFGIRIPLDIRKRAARTRQLTARQYITAMGIFGWGGAMFAGNTVDELIRSKLYSDPYVSLSATGVAINLVTWSGAGLLFGLLTWTTSAHRSTTSHE